MKSKYVTSLLTLSKLDFFRSLERYARVREQSQCNKTLNKNESIPMQNYPCCLSEYSLYIYNLHLSYWTYYFLLVSRILCMRWGDFYR